VDQWFETKVNTKVTLGRLKAKTAKNYRDVYTTYFEPVLGGHRIRNLKTSQRRQETAHQLIANEPRRRAARKPTSGPRSAGGSSAGSVSFARFNDRVGYSHIGNQIEVAVVANTVEFSLDGQVIKRQPIRHCY
jgi:hypothetical protein